MGVIRRRFYKVQYIFFVALFISSIYLLSGKNEKLNVNEPVEELTANFIPHHEIPQVIFLFRLQFLLLQCAFINFNVNLLSSRRLTMM